MSALFHAASQALQPPYGGNDANTKLLVRGDSTKDLSPSNQTLTIGGTPSTTQKKFGNTSLFRATGGPIVYAANGPDFDFGAGDFCVEGWFYLVSTASTILFSRRPTSGYGSLIYRIESGAVTVQSTSTPGTWDILETSALGAPPINSWFHLAVYRIGTNFYGAINGSVVLLGTSSAALLDGAWPPAFGADANGTQAPNFYLDEARISKGVSRYPVTNFTPPTRPFT